MAYSIRLPIYILCQRGLSEEGLIESKFDWVVQYVDMESTDFEKPEVTQSLRNWVKERVIPHSRVPRLIRSLQGKIKVSELTARDIVATVAVLATSFSAGIATAGFLPLFKSGFLPLLK